MPAAILLALIDDLASVLDDVAVLSQLAARKTAGVLGDDLALNAQQVAGVRAERELPVVWAVARGSLVNKAILVPVALGISVHTLRNWEQDRRHPEGPALATWGWDGADSSWRYLSGPAVLRVPLSGLRGRRTFSLRTLAGAKVAVVDAGVFADSPAAQAPPGTAANVTGIAGKS